LRFFQCPQLSTQCRGQLWSGQPRCSTTTPSLQTDSSIQLLDALL
jgi:hypothetical protein